MAIGKQLKKILNDKKMTVKELAEKSGVSVNTLYGIIARDNLTIKPDIAVKIKSVLEIDESIIPTTQNTKYNSIDCLQEHENEEPRKKHYSILEFCNTEDLMQTYDENLTLLIKCYSCKLNKLGQKEAAKRVEELTQIKKYTEPRDTQTENEKEV